MLRQHIALFGCIVHWNTILISLNLFTYIYPNNFGFKLLLVSMGQHVVAQ